MIARTFFRLTSLALGMAAGLAAAQATTALSVTPNPAPADQEFRLSLWGVGGSCNTVFSRESVTVEGNRIDLRYTVNTLYYPMAGTASGPAAGGAAADIPCPVYLEGGKQAIVDPLPIVANTPTFSMPPLKAGKYEVWAENIPACSYTKPACLTRIAPQSAGTLEVTGDSAARPLTYSIAPTRVPEGKDFDLDLLSYGFNCGTYFDNLSVSIAGDVITLTFLDHQRIGVMCPAIYKPYGPAFKISALKAGTYKVLANRLPACYPCKIASYPVAAGTLTVTGAVARKDWYLKEHVVLADHPFDLQLLRDDVGNCQTTFSHQSISLSGHDILATFLLENHPERVCIQDVHPYGPTFPMQGLKVGVYPVLPVQLFACEVTPPFCPIHRLDPVPTDTLIVAMTLAMPISRLRANAPKVELRGNAASFALPEGKAGSWHAELLTLDGRVLAQTAVNGAAGQRVTVPVGRAPANAVSLLRLTSPEGNQRFLPIVR